MSLNALMPIMAPNAAYSSKYFKTSALIKGVFSMLRFFLAILTPRYMEI